MNKLVVLSITMLMVGNNAQASDTLYSKAVGFMKTAQFAAGAAVGFAAGRASSQKPVGPAASAAADVKLSQSKVVESLTESARVPAAVALVLAARASQSATVASAVHTSPVTKGVLRLSAGTAGDLTALEGLLANKSITHFGGQAADGDAVTLVPLSNAKSSMAFVQFYVPVAGLTVKNVKAAEKILYDRTGFAEQYLKLEGGAAAHTLSRAADALAASVGGMTVEAHQLLAAEPGTAVTSLASSLTATAPASTATTASVAAAPQ